jgi:hypothetical protein
MHAYPSSGGLLIIPSSLALRQHDHVVTHPLTRRVGSSARSRITALGFFTAYSLDAKNSI